MVQTSERNAAIDIFRYVAALLVVALHVTALADIHPMASYLFAQVLPRISVPFFFAVSGFYFAEKLESGKAQLRRYIRKLLMGYGIWSCIYYAAKFVLNDSFSLKDFWISFFITGSEYHFWYFPALIISACVTTLFYRLGLNNVLIPLSVIVYLIGCLGHGYYAIGSRIPGLVMLYEGSGISEIFNLLCPGLPFFVSGHLVYKTINCKVLTSKRRILAYFLISFCGFLCEILALQVLDCAKDISITLGLYVLIYFLMLLLLRNPMPKFLRLSQYCRIIANFTYYVHVLLIMIYSFFADKVFACRIPETILFCIVVMSAAVIGWLLSRCKNKVVRLLIV